MGTLRATVVMQQNANTLAAVQVDTAVYATAASGSLSLQSGNVAPVYIIGGTQTASLTQIVLDTVNAAAGDRMTIKKYTTAVIGTGAAQIQVLSGPANTATGAIIGAFQVGTASPNEVHAYFDGVQWR